MKLLYTNGTGSSQTTTQANRIVVPSDYIANESFSVYTASRTTPPTVNWAVVTSATAANSSTCPPGIYHNGENVACHGGWWSVTAPTIKYIDYSDITINSRYMYYNPATDTYIWVHRYGNSGIENNTTFKYGARFTTQHKYSNEDISFLSATLFFAPSSSLSSMEFIAETGANAYIDDDGYINVDGSAYFRVGEYIMNTAIDAIMVVRLVRN